MTTIASIRAKMDAEKIAAEQAAEAERQSIAERTAELISVTDSVAMIGLRLIKAQEQAAAFVASMQMLKQRNVEMTTPILDALFEQLNDLEDEQGDILEAVSSVIDLERMDEEAATPCDCPACCSDMVAEDPIAKAVRAMLNEPKVAYAA